MKTVVESAEPVPQWTAQAAKAARTYMRTHHRRATAAVKSLALMTCLAEVRPEAGEKALVECIARKLKV